MTFKDSLILWLALSRVSVEQFGTLIGDKSQKCGSKSQKLYLPSVINRAKSQSVFSVLQIAHGEGAFFTSSTNATAQTNQDATELLVSRFRAWEISVRFWRKSTQSAEW